jgi:hypothetical protein
MQMKKQNAIEGSGQEYFNTAAVLVPMEVYP